MSTPSKVQEDWARCITRMHPEDRAVMAQWTDILRQLLAATCQDMKEVDEMLRAQTRMLEELPERNDR